MIARTLPTLSKWIMTAIVVAALPFLKPSLFVVAAALLILRISLIPGRSVPYELFVILLTTLSLPVLVRSIWPHAVLAVLLVLPALPWLTDTLRRGSRRHTVLIATAFRKALVRLPAGRGASPYLIALTAGLLVVCLIGIVASQPVLAGGALLLLGFLWGLVALSYRRVPAQFVVVRPPTVRVLARETLDIPITLSARTLFPLNISLEPPNAWTTIVPTIETLNGEGLRVKVTVTPPLAGPSTVSVSAGAFDPWGLTILKQHVDLVHLRVIPRAAYATWLARRYLEETKGGSLALTTGSGTTQMGRGRRGLDYYGARPYEPGDGLKDLLWKQMLKLNQYVVKERRDDQSEPVLIVARLQAADPEGADWLAYSLLTAAITLARDGVPIAFAAYTGTAVMSATPPLSPRSAVVQALELIERIQVTPRPRRMLEAPVVARLRRTISRLATSRTDPARRLARVLSFEYAALQSRARAHPASAAIRRAVGLLAPPATVLLVADAPDERDVLDVVLERVQGVGVHVMPSMPRLNPPVAGTRNELGRARAGSGVG